MDEVPFVVKRSNSWNRRDTTLSKRNWVPNGSYCGEAKNPPCESNWPRKGNRVPPVSQWCSVEAYGVVDVGNWDNWRNPMTWRLSFAKHGYLKRRRRRRPRKQSKIDGIMVPRGKTNVYSIVTAAVSKLGVFTSIHILKSTSTQFCC